METNEVQSHAGKLPIGHHICPSCHGDDWKSAELVVLEGTTNTSGTTDGKVTDPGAFSGGLRAFLLSDRWFSWDYDIETEVDFTTTTALVQKIRELMLRYGDSLTVPEPPIQPLKPRTARFRELLPPKKPETPIRPVTPSKPDEPEALPLTTPEGAVEITVVCKPVGGEFVIRK